MSRKLRVTTQHLLHLSGSKAATPTLATKCKRKGEKIQITFFPHRGSNPVRRIQSPALYHVAIKAGFYRKAVEVYLISKLLQLKTGLTHCSRETRKRVTGKQRRPGSDAEERHWTCALSKDLDNPAYSQSGHNLHWSHFGQPMVKSFFMRTTETDQTAQTRSESMLGAHVRRYSHSSLYRHSIQRQFRYNDNLGPVVQS